MKGVRKLVLMGLSLVCIGCFTACGKSTTKRSVALQEWMEPSSKLKVLSTTAMLDDLVAEIGGEYVLHSPLIQGSLDPHSYELVKGDHEKIQQADLVFFNGLDLEHGASLKFLLENDPKAISLGKYLLQTHSDQLIYIDSHIDPHVWMDVALFAKCIDPIARELAAKDPEHHQDYLHRAQQLHLKMDKVDKEIYGLLQSIPEHKRYLIASHDAFFYFTKRYLANPQEQGQMELWKARFSAPEGLAPDGQISTQDIQKIIDHACKHKIMVVFPESNVSRDGVKKIASVLNKKGLKTKLAQECLYGDAMGDKDSGAESYLKMMLHNAYTINKYLEPGKSIE